jgi:hypothetical protein
VPEGLSASEVGKEIAHHKKQATGERDPARHDRWLSIVGALLLSLGAVLAAYSGYAAAKWSTESSVTLAKASAQRMKANRADIEAVVTRTLDSVSFNSWFTAFTAGDADAQRLAERRMRPGYRPGFNPWQATDPAHNPSAPPGPAYMPQYVIAQDAVAEAGDREADAAFVEGSEAGRSRTSTSVRPSSSRPCCSWWDQRALPDTRGARRPDRHRRDDSGLRGDPAPPSSRTPRVAGAKWSCS